MDVKKLGNCQYCYYATGKRATDKTCKCARYPKWELIDDRVNHFCGEFISVQDVVRMQ